MWILGKQIAFLLIITWSAWGNLNVWFTSPASDWEKEGFPLGNGSIGAMQFGDPKEERIQFTEKTVWEGGPHVPGYHDGNKINSHVGSTLNKHNNHRGQFVYLIDDS